MCQELVQAFRDLIVNKTETVSALRGWRVDGRCKYP